MTIDIKPEIRQADDLENTIMEVRGIKALYVVKLANGKEYSVKWDEKELAGFCPQRTVSEMLKSWEESIQSQHKLIVNALETGLHPYWTRGVENERTGNMTGKYKTVPEKLDTYHSRPGFELWEKRLKAQLGPLTFEKIVPFKKKYNSIYEIPPADKKGRMDFIMQEGKTFKLKPEHTFAYDDEKFKVKVLTKVTERKCEWKYEGEEIIHVESKKEFYEENRPFNIYNPDIQTPPDYR